MALDLSLSYIEFNDNKAIKFTDTTGVTTGGWGYSGNLDVTDIDGSTHTLELQIDITTSDNTTTSYDHIDLYDEFGPFTDTDDLVFTIDASMLISSGSALGTSSTQLPDGIYEIVYIFDRGLGTVAYVNYKVLIDGQVRKEVYDELRQIPVQYTCKEDFRDTFSNKDIVSALTHYSYLKGLEASSVIAKDEELLDILATLETIYKL
jgi:hypothetical protein